MLLVGLVLAVIILILVLLASASAWGHARRAMAYTQRTLDAERARSSTREQGVRNEIAEVRAEMLVVEQRFLEERVLRDEAVQRTHAAVGERDALIAQIEAEPTKWLDELVRKHIAVHTTGDMSIEGYVVGVYPDSIVLANASVMIPDTGAGGGGRENLEGEQVVPRANIHWIATPVSIPEAT